VLTVLEGGVLRVGDTRIGLRYGHRS
jgi:hypothetical protein